MDQAQEMVQDQGVDQVQGLVQDQEMVQVQDQEVDQGLDQAQGLVREVDQDQELGLEREREPDTKRVSELAMEDQGLGLGKDLRMAQSRMLPLFIQVVWRTSSWPGGRCSSSP